jgi:hypothetical protein
MIAAVGERVSSSSNRAAILRPSSEITCVYLIVVRASRCGFHAFRHGNETVMDGEGVPMATRSTPRSLRFRHASAIFLQSGLHPSVHKPDMSVWTGSVFE